MRSASCSTGPSETALDDVLPEWRLFASAPTVVFEGGPVAPEAVIALARTNAPDAIDGLGTDPRRHRHDRPRDRSRSTSARAIDQLRVFVGYSGWGPGQLEAELEQHAWFVVNMKRDDPFAPTPDRLWFDVVRRQRGKVAMFANYPEDATAN